MAEFVKYFALLKEMPARQVPKAVAAAVERVDLSPRACSPGSPPLGYLAFAGTR